MKSVSGKAVLMATASLFAAPAFAQVAPAPQAAEEAQPSTSDIVVTARRRDERLQDVPVSVSAFSAATLERNNIQTATDLKSITPGFTFASEGGKDTMALTLRGIGNLPLGEGTPGVVIYVNNVALPAVGSNIPTYDVANVQVLKGPQGTLFGKNTLGGAVLINTQEPVYSFSGYVQGIYGRYDHRELEGAINVPIIDGKVALRVAGQTRRQDPRIKALDSGPGFDNIHQDSFRVSLLVEPTDWIRSLTVLDYSKANELAGGLNLIRQNFPLGAVFGPGLAPLDAQIQSELAQQRANEYGSFDGGINGGYADRKQTSIINNTSLTFGDITVRNIFGFRKNFSNQLINTGATNLSLPVAPGVSVPFTLFTASQLTRRKYLSNEFQVLGDFGAFNFIVGAYYNKDQSYGPSGSQFTAFSVGAIPAPPITAHVTNNNKAIFGQIGYKITDRLTFNAGGRYSWDKVSSCGGLVGDGSAYATNAVCRAQAATGALDGVGIVENKGSAPSWTFGLDYKVNPDWLLYGVTRRGYRGANVNTPLFESRFTTGGTDPACVFGGGVCPDLRPFQKTGKETVTDVELGSKISFSSGEARGHLNVAAYYAKYKNALQFLNVTGVVPNGAPDTPTNTAFGANISDQTITGVEFEASVSPVPSLTVSFNGAYTHVKIDKVSLPTDLPAGVVFSAENINKFSPTFSGTFATSWTLPIQPLDGKVTLDADVFMTADFGGQNGEKLPGYNLVNAQLAWRNIGGTGLDVAGFLKNAFNERYYSGASVLLLSFPISSAYLGEPRTWGLKARYSF
jgi:iron complex outermembrane receptor protein